MGGAAFLQADDSVLVVGGRGDGVLDESAPTELPPAEVFVSCELDGRCLPDE